MKLHTFNYQNIFAPFDRVVIIPTNKHGGDSVMLWGFYFPEQEERGCSVIGESGSNRKALVLMVTIKRCIKTFVSHSRKSFEHFFRLREWETSK